MKFALQPVSISQISGNNLARSKRSPDHQLRLNESVKKFGILQPLLVRKTPTGYELISGFGRLEAAATAGITEVPCQVFDGDLPAIDLLVLACQENNVRSCMSFLDQVDALERIIKGKKLTDTEAGKLIGLNQSVTSKILSTKARIAEDVMLALSQAGYGYSFAYPLSKVPHEEQRELFKRMTAEKWTRQHLEEAVKPTAKYTVKFGQEIGVTISFPKDSTYEAILALISDLMKEMKRRESQQVPLAVLPKVMA